MASLRTYLVAMILLASVPMALFMSLQILRDVRAQNERLDDSLQRSASVLAEGIDRELVASLEALVLLSDAAAPGGVDVPALVARLRERPRLRPSWQAVFVADAQGQVLEVVAGNGSPLPSRLGQPAATVSDLVEAGDKRLVALSVPLGGGVRMGAWIDVAHWQRLLLRLGRAQGGYASVFDGQYRVIARTESPERYVGRRLPAGAVQAMGGRPQGVHRTNLLDGAPTFVAWHKVGGTPWGVAVGVLAEPIEQQHRHALVTAVSTAAFCLLLGVTLALWMARRVTGPLQALGAGGGGLAPGRHEPDSPVREIAALRDAVVSARQEEAAARLRLQRKADEFEALFRGSPIGLAFAQDPQCRKVLRNRALNDMMRPPSGAAETPLEVWHEGRLLSREELPLAVAARTGQPVPVRELELRFGGGADSRFVIMQTVPLLDTDGASRGAIAALLDITDRKRAEAQLLETDRERVALIAREQAARREAEMANQAKDEFLAMLGHELRNPLNAVASAIEVLKLLGGGGPQADDARGIIGRQTRHLAHLMDDLLDMARVASGKVVLERRTVDLAKLVSSLVATMRLSGDVREHTLTMEVQEAWIDADSTRIEQVAGNLLTNALKYTPPGGRVLVKVMPQGREAVLEVRDNGVGIPPHLLERAFDLFVQGERTLDRRAGGLGVGLTLVKRLVQLHGGSVAAESDGEGSVFRVRLPLVASPPPADARGTPGRLRGRSVLLVEDNDDALHALKSVLELDGHRVSTANDGEQGLALLLQQLPEVAVVDIGLPTLTGFELARRSRAAGYAGRLIALSGYGLETSTRQALQSGFDAHLTKPVDFDRLRELFEDR